MHALHAVLIATCAAILFAVAPAAAHQSASHGVEPVYFENQTLHITRAARPDDRSVTPDGTIYDTNGWQGLVLGDDGKLHASNGWQGIGIDAQGRAAPLYFEGSTRPSLGAGSSGLTGPVLRGGRHARHQRH